MNYKKEMEATDMNIKQNKTLAFITARGGSKSIPLKNIVPVCGKPLIEYSIDALKKANTVDKIICSTDSEQIANVCKQNDVKILQRPEHLGGDLVNSIDVVIDAAKTLNEVEGAVAEIILLIQPTSIFLTSTQIDKAVSALLNNPKAKSSQTVVKVPHQFHAHNQRIMTNDSKDIYFAFLEERNKGYSKQTKPEYYTYGNLIITRTLPLLKENTLFARPSIPIEIPYYYSYDLDTQEDIEMAELMITNNLVELG